MLFSAKAYLKNLFSRCGVEVRRQSKVPFGTSWIADLAFFSKGNKPINILDVGANKGQTALSLGRAFNKARIYCFEPAPSTFETLKHQIRSNRNIRPYHLALGEAPGTGRVTNVPLSGGNTLLLEEKGTEAAAKAVEVRISTVDEFCSEMRVEEVELLKIDTEGYEMNVLKGAEQLLLKGKIKFIVAECDFFRRMGEPHGDFVEIYTYLKPKGFNVVSFYTGGVDDLGWIWGNVLLRYTKGFGPGLISASPNRVPKERGCSTGV
jgi:FkbM family methyltransferase